MEIWFIECLIWQRIFFNSPCGFKTSIRGLIWLPIFRCLWKASTHFKEFQALRNFRYTKPTEALITCRLLIHGTPPLPFWLTIFRHLFCLAIFNSLFIFHYLTRLCLSVVTTIMHLHKVTRIVSFMQFQSIRFTRISIQTTFGGKVTACNSWRQRGIRIWLKIYIFRGGLGGLNYSCITLIVQITILK